MRLGQGQGQRQFPRLSLPSEILSRIRFVTGLHPVSPLNPYQYSVPASHLILKVNINVVKKFEKFIVEDKSSSGRCKQ